MSRCFINNPIAIEPTWWTSAPMDSHACRTLLFFNNQQSFFKIILSDEFNIVHFRKIPLSVGSNIPSFKCIFKYVKTKATENSWIYLSTVRCAVKRNTSSRRRRQLHPSSSALQITPWQASVMERQRNETPSQANEMSGFIRRRSASYGGTSKQVGTVF